MTDTPPVDSERYDEMIIKYKDGEVSEREAREFFGEEFEKARETVVALRHIDASDEALDELSEMDFEF
ncbi:hypothetical protein ACFQMM_02540 [Saliphagus sp. GCM10025308]